jgi:hypothetical protein
VHEDHVDPARGNTMDGPKAARTMRLRYDGACAGCGLQLRAGTRAHYLPQTSSVRCLGCGPTEAPPELTVEKAPPPASVRSDPTVDAPASTPTFVPWPAEAHVAAPMVSSAESVLSQGALPRGAPCGDCGRKLRRDTDAVYDDLLAEVLCLECVTLDTVHSLGTPARTPSDTGTHSSPSARRSHPRPCRRPPARPRVADRSGR